VLSTVVVVDVQVSQLPGGHGQVTHRGVAPIAVAQSTRRTRPGDSTGGSTDCSRTVTPADTAKQRFMEETYNKETSIRLGWFFSPTVDCQEDCQARELNTEDAMDRSKRRKLIKDDR